MTSSHARQLKTTLAALSGFLVVVCFGGYAEAQAIPENTAAACQDGVDNDGDGYVDCQDQDCGAIVTCARGAVGVQSGLVLPGLLPRRPVEPTGRGMGTAGIVLSSTGLAFMATAMVLGFVDIGGESDDEIFGVMMGTGLTGLVITQIGNGLLLGALARTNRSTRALGVPARPGTLIAGWVLWGLTMATPGLGVGLMQIDPEPPVGVTFVGPLVLGIATFATAVAGWSANKSYYRQAVAQRQPTSFTMAPFLASTPHGTIGGVGGTF